MQHGRLPLHATSNRPPALSPRANIAIVTLGNGPNIRTGPDATTSGRAAAIARSIAVIFPMWCVMELKIADDATVPMRFWSSPGR